MGDPCKRICFLQGETNHHRLGSLLDRFGDLPIPYVVPTKFNRVCELQEVFGEKNRVSLAI